MPNGERVVISEGKPIDRADAQRTFRPVDCMLSLVGVSQHNAAKEKGVKAEDGLSASVP